MARDARVSALLGRWEDLREGGREPSPEELCRDCPELTETVRRMVGVLRAFDPLDPGLASTHPHETRSPAAPPPVPPGYAIVRELGRGGMGVVYEAVQLSLNRSVALKMILAGAHAGADDRERFRREGEAMARLQHPNIVQVFEVGEAGGLPFCVLEYVPGGTLAKSLRDHLFPPAEAARFCQLLAEAVEVAHRAGVVHRDLKPGNILLSVASRQSPVVAAAGGSSIQNARVPEGCESGRQQQLATGDWQLANLSPKITDFGLVKLLDAPAAGPSRHETMSGAVIGTPSYMAPEQARGEKSVGPATDVYALGAILYEMLTRRPPFLAASVVATLDEVVSSEPVPPRRLNRSVPRDLETVCLKCLEKNPDRRYATARELADDLGRFLAGVPVRARPVGSVERGWRWCRRNPGVSAALTALVLVLVAATAVSAAAAVRERHAAKLADQRKREADDNYRRARGTVDDLFVAVAEGKLNGLPGAQPIRKDLLRLALKYYQEFLAERADDPTNREAIATTYTKVAMIVGEVETAEAAVAWHEKAVAGWRELVAAAPDQADYRRELAGALDRYGLHLSRTSRLDDALRAQVEAVSLLDARLAAEPENLSDAGYLSRALTNLAATQGRLGRSADAVRTSERGIVVDEALARRQPRNLALRRNMVSKYVNLGLDLGDLGRLDEAIRALETASRVAEGVVAEWEANPDKPAYIADAISNPFGGLAAAELNLGVMLLSDERWSEARRRLLAAAETCRTLAAANPSVRHYRELALAAETNAVRSGYLAGVSAVTMIAEWDRAVATGTKLVADDGSNPTYRARLGLAHAVRCAGLARLGKSGEAHDAWASARSCFGPEGEKNAGIRQLRGTAWEMRATALLDLKDAAGAAEFTQAMVDLNPDYAGVYVVAARLLVGCARLSPPDVRAKYEDRAIELLRGAVQKGYRKFDRLRVDAALESIRDREQFRTLVADTPPQ